jgi:hypothetical protein
LRIITKFFFFLLFFINAPLYSLDFKANEWNNNFWDLRLTDVPKVGVLYAIDDNAVLFRLSTPITFPILLIPPLSFMYASSYWGVDALLGDFTFGIESQQLSKRYVARLLPVSVWGGVPFSSNLIGLYTLLEIAPLSFFSHSADDYTGVHTGIGINIGLKVFVTEFIDADIKYENYFAYSDIQKHHSFIGIYFNCRLDGVGNHVVYLTHFFVDQ